MFNAVKAYAKMYGIILLKMLPVVIKPLLFFYKELFLMLPYTWHYIQKCIYLRAANLGACRYC